MPRAIIWNHRYNTTRGFPEWDNPMCWTIRALRDNGWDVQRHPEFTCTESLEVNGDLQGADLVLYTHTTDNHVRGFNGPQWFIKSTAPDQFHATLDTLGYGPFSSITYSKPDFESVADSDLDDYFATKVSKWIDARTSKWGDDIFTSAGPGGEDYVLVLAQTFKDETVDGMWFGNYWTALYQVVNVLAQIEPRVVVKLHPWTDGHGGFDCVGKPKAPTTTEHSDKCRAELEKIGPNVEVYSGMGSVHDFIKQSRCVVLCNSSSGLDALLHKKPIISWGYPEYHWAAYDMRHLCELPRALDLTWFNERRAAQFIYWYTERYCIYDQASANRRVGKLLSGIETYEQSVARNYYQVDDRVSLP